jgi:polar amino acid transport system substrate-binding protein
MKRDRVGSLLHERWALALRATSLRSRCWQGAGVTGPDDGTGIGKGGSLMQRMASVLGAVLLVGLIGAGAPDTTFAQDVPTKGQSPTVDKIREAGKLRAGIAVALPWLGQDPKTGRYFGATYDLGQRLAQVLGVKLETVPSGWDVIVAGLQAKQFELALAPMFATEKRKAVMDFATYTEAGTCYMMLKTNAKVAKLEDLNKPEVVIGTNTGTGSEQEIRKKYPRITINSVVQPPGGGTRVTDVLTGRIDVAPFDSPLGVALQQKYPQLRIIPEANVCIRQPDVPVPIGLGFAKGDPAWAKFVTAVVDSMKPQLAETIAKFSTPEFLASDLGD